MSIELKVQQVEKLFLKLDVECAQFEQNSGLHCIVGCGKCCVHPEIDASPLEFLPWAFHMFLNGEAETKLNSLNESKSSICAIYKPLSIVDKGSCGSYKYRGLICRLFGNAASTDKYGALRMVTCKTIKEGQSKAYLATETAIKKGLNVPLFTDYYMQLNQIDYNLGKTILPINLALKMALEEVLQYYAYRPLPLINGKAI